MSSHVAANNELLSLWLRASGGLPADEARELIERLAAMEVEYEQEIQQYEDDIRGLRDVDAMLKSAEAERDELRSLVPGLRLELANVRKRVAEAIA